MSLSEPMKPILRDADARASIQEALDQNVMVLAGAGAGKTHELVGRMIALLASGRVQVDQMAAITFTRKAAGELRGRFVQRLRKSLVVARGNERDRLIEALQQADQCFMGTIHAFCGRMLRERPVEAGVPPDFGEIEKEDEKRLARQAWDAYIRGRYAGDDPRLLALEEAGIFPEDLFHFYCQRNEVPELPLRANEVPLPPVRRAAGEAIAFAGEVASNIPSVLSGKKDGMMETAERVSHFARNRGIESDADAIALLELFSPSPRVTLKCWAPRKDYARSLRDEAYPEFIERVVAPILRGWREHLYPRAATLVDEAVASYANFRRMHGKLTFADLLLLSADMLRRHPEVRKYFKRRYRAILVDEFQDTDPVQAEILLYLTGTDVQQDDWRVLVPEQGSLFLVGDEKQSIYRFRRADVETFRFVQERIAATGGLVLNLNTSFRSLGKLCDWVNTAFPAVFSLHPPAYQTAYGELYDHRPPGADDRCVRTIKIPKIDGNTNQAIVEQEAERIAAFIRAAIAGQTPHNGAGEDALLKEHAEPQDFLILARYTRHLSIYAAALERAGVPYDVTGSKNLGRSEEVRALVTLLRVVHEPDNAVHYLAFLRGLFVGLSDEALYVYRRAGGQLRCGSSIPDSLDRELAKRLMDAAELVTWVKAILRERTPAAAIEALLERTGLLAFSASRPLGSSRAGNILRVLSLVRILQDKGLHWGEIVTELQAVVDHEAYELGEMTLSYGSAGAVRIMNVHQAKGLQADVVFLADPYGRKPRYGIDRHLSRVGADPHLSILIQRPIGYSTRPLAQPVGWEEDVVEEEKYASAEEARLLYVAATRARNLLVVSMYPEKIGEGRYGLLDAALADVPELEPFVSTGDGLSTVPSPAVPVRSDAVLDVENIATEQRARFARIAASGYTSGTVSGSMAETALAKEIAGGRGRDFGAVIHTVLEDAVRGRIPKAETEYCRALCEESGLDETAVEGAVAVLGAFRRSRLWEELQSAARVYTEVPVGLLERESGTTPALVRGKIDLIYQAGAGWKIVDYKTDLDASAGQLPLALSQYAAQVQRYADYWERISGETVISCSLYGTVGAGGLVSIPRTGGD